MENVFEKELSAAVSAARDAGKVLMENYGKVAPRYKKDRSIVTDSDVRSEALIKEALTGKFPEYSFLGEESGLEDRGSEYTWVIDPLDGTTNYSIRNPFFNVSIALVKDSRPVVGVVYYPFQDELFSAVRGEGARLNGERISVSGQSEMRDSLVCFCHAHERSVIEDVADIFLRVKLETERMRQIGAAALELSYVACGRVECFFMLRHNPWDVAAGSLLVEEAGGKVTDRAGKPFTLKARDLVASNGRIHERLLELMNG